MDEGQYKKNVPVGTHKRWNRQGILIEEMEYHDAKNFDKKFYNNAGALIYESKRLDDGATLERTLDEETMEWSEKKVMDGVSESSL